MEDDERKIGALPAIYCCSARSTFLDYTFKHEGRIHIDVYKFQEKILGMAVAGMEIGEGGARKQIARRDSKYI